MELREARPEDAAAIEGVRLAGWRAAYGEILDADHLAGLTVTPERIAVWQQRIAHPAPGAVVLVGQRAGTVLGVASLEPSGDPDLDAATTAELGVLYVDPEHWGTGLGGRLLDEGFARMPQPLQVLWTLEGNARARRFYERRGFTLDGERKQIDLGRPVTELRYRRAAPGRAT